MLKNSPIENSKNHKRWCYSAAIDTGSVWCGQYHLLWFLLFSMCKFFNVAVNKCINWCFVHLYRRTTQQGHGDSRATDDLSRSITNRQCGQPAPQA